MFFYIMDGVEAALNISNNRVFFSGKLSLDYRFCMSGKALTLSCLGGGCSAPPLRFFADNSEREKDNSTKFGDFS